MHVARSTSISRSVTPASAAAAIQGPRLASWSRREITTSSPGRSTRTIERERANVREVMFWPNLTSAGEAAPRRSATAWCASRRIASLRTLVAKAPWAFALASR